MWWHILSSHDVIPCRWRSQCTLNSIYKTSCQRTSGWIETRANYSRKVREIESRSWERWLGCNRPVPPDDHLQEARSSRWSFARGGILWMIICKWLDPLDNHLQVAGSSGWSFARGWILLMIICKRPDPLDDHLQEAGSSRWSFARGRILKMIICKRPNPPDDHF